MTSTAPTPASLRDLGYIEATEFADLIGIDRLTLRNWRSAGRGPAYVKVHGERVVYHVDELRKWLASRTVKPQATPTLVDAKPTRARITPRPKDVLPGHNTR